MEPVKFTADSRPFMIQLAKMTGMEWAPIRRMVLVLDIDHAPRLYVESFLGGKPEDLPDEQVEIVDKPVIVSVTDKGVIVEEH